MKRHVALGLAAALVLLAALVIVSAWKMTTRSRHDPAATSSREPSVGTHELHARAAGDAHADASVTGGAIARAPGAPGAPPDEGASERSAGGATPTSTATAAGTSASPGDRTATARRLPDGGSLPSGTLGSEQIRDVVRGAIPELRFCFEWQLSRHPDLAGRVTLEFRIAEDGTVEEPSIAEDELGDETVLRCFRGVTSRMRFPPPEGGPVTVRYPITLEPGDEPPAPPTETPAE